MEFIDELKNDVNVRYYIFINSFFVYKDFRIKNKL